MFGHIIIFLNLLNMLKKILEVSGANELSKESQSAISGGLISLSDCPSGCFSLFFCPSGGGDLCAVPSPSGATCFGTHINGQCCL
ncbi:hypothetical protein [uncultured Aquimarina sp.]|uniref:hypothetical protein n=1 Tax=uncultured Aquimarina sp. TaxID=575652 RepID=UPI0026030130|nr:hypothetical protein [uncultured Aquimarina sp.]